MSFMTNAVLSQIACVASKNDAISWKMYVWRTLPFIISIFLKKQENRISEKQNIEVSLHWFSKILIPEGVWLPFGHFCDRKSSLFLIRDLDPSKYCCVLISQTFKTLHFTSDLFKLYWNTEDSVFRFETGFGFIYEREGKLFPSKKKKKKKLGSGFSAKKK